MLRTILNNFDGPPLCEYAIICSAFSREVHQTKKEEVRDNHHFHFVRTGEKKYTSNIHVDKKYVVVQYSSAFNTKKEKQRAATMVKPVALLLLLLFTNQSTTILAMSASKKISVTVFSDLA